MSPAPPFNVPLPPPPPATINLKKTTTLQTEKARQITLDKCLWAANLPELQKGCYLARVCQDQAPKKCRFRNINGILQTGPTCGLTALSMLLDGKPSPDELLLTAKQLNYTMNGEMFSARYLFQLICKYIQPTKSETKIADLTDKSCLECELHDGLLNTDKIRRCLLEDACIFVPYPL